MAGLWIILISLYGSHKTQIDLLREVIDGKKIFAPKSDSVDDMNSFQVEAEELIELDEKNLLIGCRPKRESYTGK